MDDKSFLIDQLREIEKWEKEQKRIWFWEKISRLPFVLLDRLTPAWIHKKMAHLLDELGQYIQTGGQYLVNKGAVLSSFYGKITLNEVRAIPLQKMNEACEKLVAKRKTFATYQGATTGFGGALTLLLDVAVVLGTALKTLQEIAIIYGFDPHEKEERLFILKCLQFSLADVVGKQAILNEWSSKSEQQTISQLQGWREIVWAFRDQYGWKKLFQAIPIAGMVFGAWTNQAMIADIAETGAMFYRKRRIMEKLQEMKKAGEPA
ncbi:EcsC family protein [Anoxybacillus suryakundensis]|uniref:EcsC protein family n=1 Tax=Anoxybacillus suryakundensis TaxID=1325335 RepID=A0A0K6GL63_9BACL|nr:EcsC family protein [Anoxybacillus suryakundensis]CUA79445.1 EcsC protein family [Anoxybacillus suryakundensis]